MAGQLADGRVTDAHHGPVVVFLIGMRINRFRAVGQWLPVARAMPQMIKELAGDPSSGLLGARPVLGGPRELSVIQYWRDQESLLAYASEAGQKHRPAWQAFNRRARALTAAGHRPAVGIWHETYLVPEGGHETVYVNMPPTGLGQAIGTEPVAGRGERAAQRLGGA